MKLKGTLSLDLDNQWAYLKARGDPSWESFPSYLEVFIPLVLTFFRERGSQATFFVVGQDANQPKNQPFIQSIFDEGHEIGNHSYYHEPWMKNRSTEAIIHELDQAKKAIASLTGKAPVGFRGPGFCRSEAIQEILSQNDYLYDSSLFSSLVSPLARLYYKKFAALEGESKKNAESLYGSASDLFRSNRNRVLKSGLVEMPVTTIPLLKVPFHMSYLIFLAQRSESLMKSYLQIAMAFCKATKTPPNFLLHPTDFLGNDSVKGMDFFPGMSIATEKKVKWVAEALNRIESSFSLEPMQVVAKSLKEGKG